MPPAASPANHAKQDDELSRLRHDMSETQAMLRELLAQKTRSMPAHAPGKSETRVHPTRTARRRTRAKV